MNVKYITVFRFHKENKTSFNQINLVSYLLFWYPAGAVSKRQFVGCSCTHIDQSESGMTRAKLVRMTNAGKRSVSRLKKKRNHAREHDNIAAHQPKSTKPTATPSFLV